MAKTINSVKHELFTEIQILSKSFDMYEIGRIKEQIEKILEKLNFPNVVFNLINVEFIDSIGIGFFISLKNIFIDNKSEMVIVSKIDRVVEVLKGVKIDNFCFLFNALEDAETFIHDKAV